MRFSARTWSLLSLLLFVAAAFFWLKGNEHEARRKSAAPAVVTTNASTSSLDLFSTKTAGQLATLAGNSPAWNGVKPVRAEAIKDGEVEPEEVRKRFPFRLRNTQKPLRQLVRDDNAVLLANALIDTMSELPQIPEHLRAEADPGSYIVQWDGPVDENFRARLSELGAEIISYVPNNAYFVKVGKIGADQLAASPGVQTVLPYQPYYKLDPSLLGYAVKQEPLPENAMLRVTFLPGAEEMAAQVIAAGAQVIAEEKSPFGPQLIVQPAPNALVPLAKLSSVQGIERSAVRMPASDLTRITMGVATNGTAENYLGLSGQGVLVNVNDTGIQPSHPALQGTTIHLPAPPLAGLITTNNDPEGHGTFVASLIAGNGDQTPSTYTTNAAGTNGLEVVTQVLPGSPTNTSLRGIAPSSDLLVLPLDPSGPRAADPTERLVDTWLIETAARSNYVTLARTNTLISNNSWTYNLVNDYDSAAARFDQAVRDALPGAPNNQPLLFVFAAGNRGFGDDDGLGGSFDSIESPGTAKNVITVGALESPRFITNAFYTKTNYFYTTNIDGTIQTNESSENIYPFAESTDSDDEVASFSSRGNVGIGLEGDLGRFKPDVVAPGTMLIAARSDGWNFGGFDTNDTNFGTMYVNLHTNLQPYRFGSGSTYAAANVSGTLALIQEYFQAKGPTAGRGSLSPALMKALLINGARTLSRTYDIAMQSAANYQGWGLPNLPNSLSSYTTNAHASVDQKKWRLRHIEQSAANALATGQSRTWNVTLSSNAAVFPLRATLVWTDPPGNPAVAVKLVNDLDLVVTNLDTGFVYYGNNISFGSDETVPSDPAFDPAVSDVINNVEQVTIGDPSLLGRRFSITVRARRVNVNAVPDYFSTTGNRNDVVQDYALVISSDIGADPELNDPDPSNPEGYLPNVDVWEDFTRVNLTNTEPRAELIRITNGLPLIDQRVGANPTLIGTNGTVGQWNFYVFTNITESNTLVTARAGSNVAFVTFNPPNLSRQRALEADIDLYVSKDPRLTNLHPAAVSTAFKSVLGGGTESIVFTNAALGDVFYIGVKAEDQQAAEFSFIGVSSDRPFEEERNGRIYLTGVPFEAAVLDGNPRRPTAGTMLAIGLSTRRIAHTQVKTTTFHENFPDLVGVLSKQRSRVILNNHSFGNTNFGTNVLTYEDNPNFMTPSTRPSDGPGTLNDFVGYKIVGPWFLEMIDNSPSHTGRVYNLEIGIDPLRDDLLINGQFSDTVAGGEFAYYPLDVPPGVTNLIFNFTGVSGTLEFYWREEALPTTNTFDVSRVINPPGVTFSVPVIAGRTYYMGLRNPGSTPVDFTLLITAQFADANFNRFFSERILEDVYDVATTNSVIDVRVDKLVSDVQVGVAMKHPRSSDIALTLISPQGSRLLLAENRGYTNTSGFGSASIITNRSTNGSTIVLTQANYVIFTDRTNLANLPVKFANPGTSNSLGSLGLAFGSSFEGSTRAGNYDPGTPLSGGWRVSGGFGNGLVSILNGPGLAHTGDTLLSLGEGGITRTFPITAGRAYTARLAVRRAAVMDFFSTGVDDLRNPIAPGIQDQHYFVVPGFVSGSFPTFVLRTNQAPFFPPTSWTPNNAFSQWISPYDVVPTNDVTGAFFFRTYVNLYEQSVPTFAATRQFRWSGDDVGNLIRVNGRTFSTFPGTPSSNFFGGSTMILPQLGPGLNVVDFFVDDTNGAEGLRVEVIPTSGPLVKNPTPEATVTIGGVSRRIQGGPAWSLVDIPFVAGSGVETLTIQSSLGEVWIDSVSVESSGSVFLHPEEPFELLEGERAMGEWRLEVRDTRTGAILPTSDVLEWSLDIAFADTRNPALQMKPGEVSAPITLGNDEVQWVVLDPCQGATYARLQLRGLGNVDRLMLFADLNGFPTGLPELDDFIPISNDQVVGGNGRATFEISTLLPAPARLTGKPIYIGIINQFLGETNSFELEFQSDGNCTISGPPPILTPDSPAVGTLDPDPDGGSNTNSNEGIFQFTIPPNARAATVTVTSDGDVTLYGQYGVIPTSTSFTYRINAVPGGGTETMRIDQSSVPPIAPGLFFVRIVNNTGQTVSFTATVTFEFDTGADQIFVNIIRTSLGGYQIQYFGTGVEPGQTYVIEASNELGATANWVAIDTRVATGAFESYPLTVELTRNYRFFRVRKP